METRTQTKKNTEITSVSEAGEDRTRQHMEEEALASKVTIRRRKQ